MSLLLQLRTAKLRLPVALTSFTKRCFSNGTNPIRCTKRLVQEHRIINQTLDAFEKLIQRTENDFDDCTVKDIHAFIDFCVNFTDKMHHEKEEGILFQTMDNLINIPPFLSTQTGPIKEMMNQHNVLRNYMYEIQNGIEGNTKHTEKVKYNIASYIEYLRKHIYKENNILWPMIIQNVSSEDMEQISSQFDKHDNENKMRTDELMELSQKLINKYNPEE
eukprot:UN11472